MTHHAHSRRPEHRAAAGRPRTNATSEHLDARQTASVTPPALRCACGGGCPQCAPGRPPSRPLDPAARTVMESRFGRDFSDVSIRIDSEAARAYQARAFTHGSSIVFDAGAYAPSTAPGQHLLAHELAHVVQQGRGRAASGPLRVSTPSDRAEIEAARAADAAMSGRSHGRIAASLHPAAPGIYRDGPGPGTPTPTPAPVSVLSEAEKRKLTPIRQELFDLFSKFEKSVIGDEVFNKVETQEAWNKQKKKEEEATSKYEEDKKRYKEWVDSGKTGPQPPLPIPVAKFTTCIATQQVILTEAFKETGLTIKKEGKLPKFALATQGAQIAEALNPDDAAGPAWHWGKIGLKERPNPGDIIVMAFRGGAIDQGAKELNYILNIKYDTAQKLKTSKAAQAKLETSQKAIDKAQKALEALQNRVGRPPVGWEIRNAETSLRLAVNALNAAKKAADKALSDVENMKKPTAEELAPAEAKLEAARQKAAEAREKRLEAPVGSKTRYLFQFSHVGFLQKIETPTDASGKEKWITFDGGQLVERGGKKIEGAKTSIRYYDPKSNEISGEAQQGGEARWLYGWVDVDKLVADK